MQFDLDRVKKYLDSFDFEKLFIEEVGWSFNDEEDVILTIKGETYRLDPLADAQGLVVYRCSANEAGDIPPRSIRREIERKLSTQKMEHLIIFCDAAETEQIWQRVRRETGKPEMCREIKHIKGRSGTLLIEKLNAITFTMEQFMEDAEISIIQSARTVDQAFALEEQVTNNFYKKFEKQRDTFISFMNGLPKDQQSWYSSVMLNRLMFIYFIQKKEFLDNNGCLDNDHDYLHNRLRQSQQKGPDRFYRHFLQPLFFGGFACPEDKRTPKDIKLLGKVPYLNGGLFMKHQIEDQFPNIDIADQAFENIFNFFEGFNWRLDERPIVDGNEINPDILGYIFEKYINQKQMGAYYTKEDITEYISKNTVISFLFDEVQRKLPRAFTGDGPIWNILRENPERYIYPAMLKGMELELPNNITIGINDVSQRGDWNTTAAEEYALPTEIWREVVARRQHCTEILQLMQSSAIQSINDLITYNLNIRQFAQDVIESSDDPELIRAFYYTLAGRIPRKSNENYQRGMSILDPTCGSGAFLFAALNILEPLYEACLDRMLFLLEDEKKNGSRTDKLKDFQDIIQQFQSHRNRRYSVLKSIIVQNLYGVDIMPEAVEICKLRLFLKLVAQVEQANELEPLPDIDFNIKAGNTLVGFTSYQEVQASINNSPYFGGLFEDPLPFIREKLEEVDRMFLLFQKMQSGHYDHQFSSSDYASTKDQLKERLLDLEIELNEYLGAEYGLDAKNKKSKKQYEQWLSSHRPFHWLVEFYGIIEKNHGFDVIIGNPPYVEYRKVQQEYRIKSYETETCGNLYAFVLERSVKLKTKIGYCGMIVPISSLSTDRTKPLQKILNNHKLWHSTFSNRPAKLFDGVEQRLAILLFSNNAVGEHFSSGYNHWYSQERGSLFEKLILTCTLPSNEYPSLGKVGDKIHDNIIKKIYSATGNLIKFSKQSEVKYLVYFHDGPTYWIRAMTFKPNAKLVNLRSNHYKTFNARNKFEQNLVAAILNSSVFYMFFKTFSNCRDFSISVIGDFPIGNVDELMLKQMTKLCDDLMADYKKNMEIKSRRYPSGDVIYEEYYPAKSKKIIDEIDLILANYYGLTSEELEYIKNYEIKYRMGLNGSADEEG
jgi:hypothetical protein